MQENGRRAGDLVVWSEGLGDADTVVVWRKQESSPMNQLVWTPEMQRINGRWYIYFGATHTQALDKLGVFQHPMFALEFASADPLNGNWNGECQIKPPLAHPPRERKP